MRCVRISRRAHTSAAGRRTDARRHTVLRIDMPITPLRRSNTPMLPSVTRPYKLKQSGSRNSYVSQHTTRKRGTMRVNQFFHAAVASVKKNTEKIFRDGESCSCAQAMQTGAAPANPCHGRRPVLRAQTRRHESDETMGTPLCRFTIVSDVSSCIKTMRFAIPKRPPTAHCRTFQRSRPMFAQIRHVSAASKANLLSAPGGIPVLRTISAHVLASSNASWWLNRMPK